MSFAIGKRTVLWMKSVTVTWVSARIQPTARVPSSGPTTQIVVMAIVSIVTLRMTVAVMRNAIVTGESVSAYMNAAVMLIAVVASFAQTIPAVPMANVSTATAWMTVSVIRSVTAA